RCDLAQAEVLARPLRVATALLDARQAALDGADQRFVRTAEQVEASGCRIAIALAGRVNRFDHGARYGPVLAHLEGARQALAAELLFQALDDRGDCRVVTVRRIVAVGDLRADRSDDGVVHARHRFADALQHLELANTRIALGERLVSPVAERLAGPL